jgi:hypothetical protein
MHRHGIAFYLIKDGDNFTFDMIMKFILSSLCNRYAMKL